jgi:hypothetical protein
MNRSYGGPIQADDLRYESEFLHETQRTIANLSQGCVDLVEHPSARAKILLPELIERPSLIRVEVGVEVFGIGGEVEKAGEDFAAGGGLC